VILMVERRNCSFCGQEIEPGTGSLYIRKDAVSYNFCSNKCRKNQIGLGRIPRRTRWTKAFVDMKAAGLSKEARARPVEGEEVEGAEAQPKAVPKKVKVAQKTGAPAKAEPKAGAAPQGKAAPGAEPKKKTAYQELRELRPEVPQEKPAAEPKAPAAEKPAEAKPKAAKPAKKPKAESPK
jgi:large subunit ribosomal protein L24e